MKFKTSAIALAVAGSVAAPMAVQAEGSVYASARIGVMSIENNSGVVGGEVTVDSYASRFGAKGETDLGNGMTGFGRYEVAVAENGAFSGGRKSYVGLKGDFGAVQLGRDYQTFYNHVVGPLDNPWAGSGYAMVAYVGRQSDTIRFDGSAGAVSFGVGLQMVTGTAGSTTAEDVDAIEVGATFGIGDMNLGVAMRDVDAPGAADPDAIIGIALSGIMLGDASIGVSYQMQDDDTGLVLDVGMAGFYLHLETADFDAASTTAGTSDGGARANTSPTALTLGYTQSLGRNTSAWYEFMSIDHDQASAAVEDSTHIRAVLKYDIL